MRIKPKQKSTQSVCVRTGENQSLFTSVPKFGLIIVLSVTKPKSKPFMTTIHLKIVSLCEKKFYNGNLPCSLGWGL